MTDTAAPTAPRRANPFGVASVLAGVLLVLMAVVTQALSPAIPLLLERTDLPYGLLGLVITLPAALVALLATVLGIIGLVVRDRRRGAAIIGTTLGTSHLVATAAGFLGSQFVTALLG